MEVEPMSKASLKVIYDGEAVQLGSMDVVDLAPSLLAVGHLFRRANEIVNGPEAKIIDLCINNAI